MATNKRKDAAALFELIDKSTLKVPKHAKAIKIPSWWSSKSNPPADMPAPTEPAAAPAATPTAATAAPVRPASQPGSAGHATHASAAHPTSAAVRVAGPSAAAVTPSRSAAAPTTLSVPGASAASASATPAAGAPAAAAPPAVRPTPLFPSDEAPEDPVLASVMHPQSPFPAEPPAVGAIPMPVAPEKPAAPAAPSIRPPAQAAPISTPVATPARAPAAPIPAQKGVFAPATMAADTAARKNWVANRQQALLRLSKAAIVTGLCAIVAIVLVTIYMVNVSQRSRTTTGAGAGAGSSLDGKPRPPQNDAGTSTAGLGQGTPAATAAGGTLRQTVEPPAPRVYEASEVTFDPALQYIVIDTSPNIRSAKITAGLLAQNGVSVVVLSQTNRGIAIVSHQGFATAKDAEALRLRIIEIGRKHPDAKGGATVFKAPYARRLTTQGAPGRG